MIQAICFLILTLLAISCTNGKKKSNYGSATFNRKLEIGKKSCLWYSNPSEKAFINKKIVADYRPFKKLGKHELILNKCLHADYLYNVAVVENLSVDSISTLIQQSGYQLLKQESVTLSSKKIQTLFLKKEGYFLSRIGFNEPESNLLVVIDITSNDSSSIYNVYKEKAKILERLDCDR